MPEEDTKVKDTKLWTDTWSFDDSRKPIVNDEAKYHPDDIQVRHPVYALCMQSPIAQNLTMSSC